jgi:hypothetical protein
MIIFYTSISSGIPPSSKSALVSGVKILTRRNCIARVKDNHAGKHLIEGQFCPHRLLSLTYTVERPWLPGEHHTIRTGISRQFDYQKRQIKKRLQASVSRIHISTDLWQRPHHSGSHCSLYQPPRRSRRSLDSSDTALPNSWLSSRSLVKASFCTEIIVLDRVLGRS